MACYGQTTHDYNMLTMLDELICLQSLFNQGYQILGCILQWNTIRPNTPP
jgi:hypothetical protein